MIGRDKRSKTQIPRIIERVDQALPMIPGTHNLDQSNLLKCGFPRNLERVETRDDNCHQRTANAGQNLRLVSHETLSGFHPR